MSKDYNPRMHSAEHILNQTMVRMFDKGRSFSAHIEKKKSKCDYHFDRDLTPGEIETIEKQVNDVIAADMPVSEKFIDRTAAEKEYNLKRLPEDAGDRIRIIDIGNYDSCPCSGSHVTSTAEIIGFKIISTDFKEGVLRLRFKLKEPGKI